MLKHHKTCGFAQFKNITATHWVGRTGNEYPKSEYINHGHGGIYRGWKDLPLDEYPYTIKYHEEYAWHCCRDVEKEK